MSDLPTSVGTTAVSESSPSSSGPRAGSPLVSLRPGAGSAIPLYLVHALDGRLDCYAELVRQAPEPQPVIGLQARGFDDGRAPMESLEAMAVFYVEALRADRPEGPYHLAGWALGAVIAWEMTRLLQRDGHAARLTLIEPPLAAADRSVSATALAAHAALFARELALQAGATPLELPTALTTGKDPEPLLQHLHAEGTSQGHAFAAMPLDVLRARFKVFSAHLRAARRYVPESFPGSARLLRAEESADATGEERERGWGVLAEEGLQLDVTPGDGHSLLREPRAAELASRLFDVAELRESRELATRPEPPPLVPVPRTRDLPLSFAQQRLWFLDQLQPGGATYNMPSFVRMNGRLDLAALQRAFDELVRRHEALRTTFLQRHDEPIQVIAPDGELRVTLVDLQDLPAEERRVEVRRRLHEEYLQPFNLSTGPLIRALVLKVSAVEHVLALNMHHIVSDGWSMGVLIQEVAALYAAFARGMPSPLPALTLQYADYAVWQRSWFQGAVLDEHLAWWRNELSGVATLDLPLDKPRPPVLTSHGAQVPVTVPAASAHRLKALCKQEGATPFMALLAAWQWLLSRYSGQDDIAVGSPIAGRQRAELEGLIGFFVNTLVFRARVEEKATFRQMLRRAKETTLGAFEHQDVPFERIVEELQVRRDLSRSPLFQVILALQTTTGGSTQGQELTLTPVEVEGTVVKFELELHLMDAPEGFFGTLTYNTDLFEHATIERMARHFELLVEATLARPDVPLGALSILDATERQKLLIDWAQVPTRVSTDDTLPDAFARVVARSADSTALLFGEESLSYRQLDSRSNQLAWHLRSLGISTDSRVAVSLERSPDLIVALLAVLKTGGAYVPLDTQYPPERLASMVEDARPSVLITSRALLPKLPSQGLTLVLLDELSLSEHPSHALPSSALPDSLAYVVFTSGSTGKPKGVACTHRGVVRTLLGVDYTHLGPDQTHLLLAPISFDATVFEVWGALLHGARLLVLPPQSPSLEDLFSAIARGSVTTLWATSGLFSQLVESRLPAPPSLQRVLTGGDVVSPLHVRTALTSWGIPVTSFYGPTETTVFASSFPMQRAEDVPSSVPIGRPTNGTRLLVLDASLQPVPVGVTGELFIGGEGVARGYLGQPALTAERFVPDPLSASPGARLYRSGDLVRWRPDGVLDFIGRSDAQVKVRGFRIELSEVEAALLSHPSVREAVALAREDVPGDKRLVGYFVADDLDPVSLRAFLKSRLPEFMVPSSLLRLDALPLTSNAKIDRKALPPPEAVLSAPSAAYVAPRTPTQELLVSIWAQVLRVPRIGITEDFFALGGHSLLATQLVSRVRTTFKVELALRELFEAPTIEALAERIDAAALTDKGAARPPLLPVPRTGDLPLSFAQQRLWLIDQFEPNSATYNIPLALLLEGPLDVDALQESFSALIERHESLRTTFVTHEGEPRQHIHPSAPVHLVRVDLQSLPEATRLAEAQRRVSEEAARPFDLARGPIFRALLLRLEAQRHVLVGTVHHIASDGWSMGVLLRELAEFYAARLSGQAPGLSALPIQYADFAAWQRGWLQGDALERQLSYWRQQLSGAPPFLELPTDRPRPAVQTNRGASYPVQLPRALNERLMAVCQQEGVTPFMALLAVWQMVLSRYAATEDISVGSPIAGRTRAETEGLIGFFVNTLVLRTQVRAKQTFRELLAQVKRATLAAYEHQDVPFEKLVEELNPHRTLSHSPLFQVMLVLQNAPTTSMEVTGSSEQSVPLRLESFGSGVPGAKFDLTLSLGEDLHGALGYRTDLFDEATIGRMVQHFATLLDGALTSLDSRVGDLPMLPAEERRQVLSDWNSTLSEVPWRGAFHQLFEAQAALTPDALAVLDDDSSLSFSALNQRSNQLAHFLRARGVGPESRVAFCLERSTSALVALLSILKAGAAYVPLDASYPLERLSFMLEDSRAPFVLTQSHLLPRLSSASTPLCLDDAAFRAALDALPSSNPSHLTLPSHPAYVIYTSGSTGRPKGVVIHHSSVVNLLHALSSSVFSDVQRPLRFSLNAPLSFDASVKQLVFLSQGHALCFVPQAAREDVPLLLSWLSRHSVDVFDCAPSHLRLLLDEGLSSFHRPLRLLIGGESIDDSPLGLSPLPPPTSTPSTSTAPPSAPSTPPHSPSAPLLALSSALPSPTSPPSSSTLLSCPLPSVSRVSSSSADSASLVATSTAPTSPLSASSPTPSPLLPALASTAPATRLAGSPTATSSTSAASTSR
ncbi:non-ribosomal peptide synthetase [Myxococcus stipitatus DSM 14675]|uniref:Non-ribosomal peptide synthetase n=1 Tax=Myxococcus stipitatus (strain DSM 14675 / JCM 12634 / Mx s8) TaxID=1278073 RepID=L7UC22_MYXSD|nr:non-ribosomal peptide synthetase [Myxococcus stipitatus DSM 14675]